MTFGFLEKTIAIESGNGRDDTLLSPLHFRCRCGILYRVPEGATTDGMSAPAIVAALPGYESTGRHWFSAILHDAAYRGTLQRMRITSCEPARLSRDAADSLFAEALATQGVGPIRRALIRTAVRLFGRAHYQPQPKP